MGGADPSSARDEGFGLAAGASAAPGPSIHMHSKPAAMPLHVMRLPMRKPRGLGDGVGVLSQSRCVPCDVSGESGEEECIFMDMSCVMPEAIVGNYTVMQCVRLGGLIMAKLGVISVCRCVRCAECCQKRNSIPRLKPWAKKSLAFERRAGLVVLGVPFP